MQPKSACYWEMVFVAWILCIWRMCTIQQNKDVILSEVTVLVDFLLTVWSFMPLPFWLQCCEIQTESVEYFDFVQNFASNTHLTYSSPIISRPPIHMTLPGNNETSTKNRVLLQFDLWRELILWQIDHLGVLKLKQPKWLSAASLAD